MPEFVPYKQFIDRIGTDKAEYHFDALKMAIDYTTGAFTKVLSTMTKDEFTESYENINKRLINQYDEGRVACVHTYEDSHGNFIDCIPFDHHPSVRAIRKNGGTVASKAPAPPVLPQVTQSDPMSRSPILTPIVPTLLRGQRDRFGRRIACPDGCVTLRRFTPAELAARGTLENWLRKYYGKPNPPSTATSHTASPSPPAPQLGTDQHLYATCDVTNVPGGQYSGCAVGLNVWDPNPTPGVFSLAQLWIPGANVRFDTQRNAWIPETIESGWTVFPTGPGVGGSSDPVLFVYFNPDGYLVDPSQGGQNPGGQSGYVNVLNNVFVQFSSPWVLMSGGQLPPSNTGEANQRAIHMMWVYYPTGNAGWYLFLGTTPQDWHGIGYFPAQYYNASNSTLRQGYGTSVRFGGEVCPAQSDYRTGQMGSGVYPNTDPEANIGEVAFCYSMSVRTDPNQNPWVPANITKGPTDDQYYGVEIPTSGRFQGWFFFGGAGAP